MGVVDLATAAREKTMGGGFRSIVPAMVSLALIVLVATSTRLIAQNEPTPQPAPQNETGKNETDQSKGEADKDKAGDKPGDTTGQSNTESPQQPAQQQSTPPPAASPTPVPAPPPASLPTNAPSVTVIGAQEARGILGNDVRSAANEDMGRIVDVIVDSEGRTRAAIIDFGGFLGVGSRRIAVDWKALHFVPAASKRYGIVLELTKDQVKLAPEVKEGKPIIVLGASGNLEPLP